MSKKTLYFLGILLTIVIGSILYRVYCCNCAKQSARKDEAQVITPPAEPTKEVVQASIPPAEPAKPDYNALKEKINDDPLTFYFSTNQSGISLTDQEKAKIADIIAYLGKVTNGSVLVTG